MKTQPKERQSLFFIDNIDIVTDVSFLLYIQILVRTEHIKRQTETIQNRTACNKTE